MEQILTAAVAVIGGTAGIAVLLWAMNQGVKRLPRRLRGPATIVMFVGPAFLFVFLAYIGPTILTFIASFTNPRTGHFVGLANYAKAINNPDVRTAVTNSVVFWLGVGATATIGLAIALAALLDQLRPRWEAITKSIFFMPMAVSAVAASAVWFLMFAYRPNPEPQIGVFNGVITLFTNRPIALLSNEAFHLNTLLLVLVTIWLGTGFAMVMISTAIKNVPTETIEAARLEGVGGFRIFRHVVFPQILPSVLTVFTTVALLSFQSFDIVFAMTNGRELDRCDRKPFLPTALPAQRRGAGVRRGDHHARSGDHHRLAQHAAGTQDALGMTTLAARTGAAPSTLRRRRGYRPGWLSVRVAIIVLVILWLIPLFGLFVTSFREEDAIRTTAWWNALLDPLGDQGWTLSGYQELDQGLCRADLYDAGRCDPGSDHARTVRRLCRLRPHLPSVPGAEAAACAIDLHARDPASGCVHPAPEAVAQPRDKRVVDLDLDHALGVRHAARDLGSLRVHLATAERTHRSRPLGGSVALPGVLEDSACRSRFRRSLPTRCSSSCGHGTTCSSRWYSSTPTRPS